MYYHASRRAFIRALSLSGDNLLSLSRCRYNEGERENEPGDRAMTFFSVPAWLRKKEKNRQLYDPSYPLFYRAELFAS